VTPEIKRFFGIENLNSTTRGILKVTIALVESDNPNPFVGSTMTLLAAGAAPPRFHLPLSSEQAIRRTSRRFESAKQ
jgi:hypothetical protein